MGRGLGPVQKAVVAALIAWPRSDVGWITNLVYNLRGKQEPSRLQIDTVNQAIRSLAKRGLIKHHPGMTYNGLTPWVAVGPIQTQKKIKRAAKKRRLSVVTVPQ